MTTDARAIDPSVRTGVALGRFQPLHLDHMEYLLAAADECDHLIVGITNPDSANRYRTPDDLQRSTSQNNPFTYFERYMMISDALIAANIHRDKFDVVPAPLGMATINEYLPDGDDVEVLLTVYDAWGERRMNLLREAGYKVRVLWRRDPADKNITGTEVRRRISNDLDWRSLVPEAVVPWIEGREQSVRSSDATPVDRSAT